MAILKVNNLAFSYGEERVLHDINFQIDSGEFIILTGENGAAKSTLVRLILGLLPPESGTVELQPTNDQGEPLQIGYVPQDVTVFNNGFPSTVQKLVESGRYPQGRWFKRLTDEDHAHVDRALESVGMAHLRNRKVGDLSGGQKQRINIARVFAQNPDFFILDEPTTGMDVASRKSFYQLLNHSSKVHHKTILMVTHSDSEMEGLYDREIYLTREKGVEWRCFNTNSSNEH